MPSPTSPSDVFNTYSSQFTSYEAAAEGITDVIRSELAKFRIPFHQANGRAKNPLELFKKQRRKRYANPWSECPDLVGARIILPESSLKSVVVDTLRASSTLEVLDVEDQVATARPDELRYQGLHVHVQHPDFIGVDGQPIRCEVQIRTIAEHAWSETEHSYIYKKPIDLPPQVARIFSRLLVLVELFDQELAKGVEQVKALESYQRLELARHLEQLLQPYAPSPADLSLSMETIEELTLSGHGSTAELGALADRFVSERSPTLAELMSAHGPGAPAFDISVDWILSQGESILLLALLDKDEYALGSSLAGSDVYPTVEALALRTGHTGFLQD